MERNTLLAIVLSILVMIGWFIIFPPPPKQVPPEAPVPEATSVSGPQQATATPVTGVLPTPTTAPRQLSPDAPRIIVDTPLLHVVLTTQGARILEWKLKMHRDTNGALLDLVSADALQLGQLPLEVFTGTAPLDEELNTAMYQATTNTVELQPGAEPVTVSLAYTTGSGVKFTKDLTFWPDSYKLRVTLKFADSTQADKSLAVAWGPGMGAHLATSGQFEPEVVSKPANDVKLTREPVKKITGLMTYTNIQWAAINSEYFTVGLFPDAPKNSFTVNMIALPPPAEGKKNVPIQQLLVGLAQPLSNGACQLTLYAGPKERAKLVATHQDFGQLINYGFFWFIAEPLAAFMSYFYGKLGSLAIPNFLKSYGLVIICLTIVIKILFYPLTHKSFQSMKKMQDLQPKMNAIRDKIKDRQQQQQAIMELYKAEKVNPMGGCLPMVLQIPVFFALYQTLAQSIELRGAPFLWVPDLSGPEPALLLPLLKPLVLLMGVSMFLQQSLTPTTGDPRQAQMFKLMPIIFTAMFWNFPAGLVLYWLTNNVLTIGQQYLINKGGKKPSKAKENTAEETVSLSRKRRKKGN